VAVSTGSPAIRTEGLTKRFGDVLALDRLDLVVERGEIFGFLGPNGAGKTTTIRLLLRLLRPTAGRAWIMGVPAEDVARAHEHVGYVSGDVALWPQLTGVEVLHLLGSLTSRVDDATGTNCSSGPGPGPEPADPDVVEGQPAEGRAGRGAHAPAGRPAARRADGRPRSADGG
jgi:hypothetical protein